MKKFKPKMALLALATLFQAQAEKNTMIVFDTSGSMWGQINGTTKIETARSAITSISQGLDENHVVGLMAYGHRRKGDCNDIETLVNPAAGTAKQIVTQVNQLQPKGKTPLSQAVKLAAEQLKFTEQQAEVVLITDGVETCDLDPCATAAELESLGIDFTAHVIGFGLSADQGKQVSCLADATGGQYLPAENASSLNEALQQVIVETDEAPEQALSLPTATIEGPTHEVVIGAGFSVNWSGPNAAADYIDVIDQGNQRVYGELAYQWTKHGTPAQLRAPGKPGNYDVRYVWHGPKAKHVLATTSIQVVESEVTLVAPTQVAAGENFAVSWQGPNREGDYVDLVKKEHTHTYGELSYFYTRVGTPGSILAPAEAGDYLIRYVMEAPNKREVLHSIPITVQPVEASLAFPATSEVAVPLTVYWTGPNNKDGYIDLVPADYTATYGEISYFYLKDQPESGELLTPVKAGEYQVRFVMQGAGGRKVITSSPITILPVKASLELPDKAKPGAVIQVHWQGPNRKGDYVDLMYQDRDQTYGEMTYFYTNGNPETGTLTMPEKPGKYKVRYVLQGKQRLVLTEKSIEVE